MAELVDVEPELALVVENGGGEKAGLPVVAGRRPVAIVPRSMSEVMAIAMTLHRSGLAPKALQTPERVAFAILAGAEVGLAPVAALRSIMIVNGVATLWGDGLLGVIRASGHLASIRETLERDDKGVPIKATCTVRRRGDDYDHVSVFNRQDAMVAGLWGKDGPWRTNPGRMLTSRARNFALRDVFSDILIGLTGPIDASVEIVDAAYADEPAPAPEPRRSDPGGPGEQT